MSLNPSGATVPTFRRSPKFDRSSCTLGPPSLPSGISFPLAVILYLVFQIRAVTSESAVPVALRLGISSRRSVFVNIVAVLRRRYLLLFGGSPSVLSCSMRLASRSSLLSIAVNRVSAQYPHFSFGSFAIFN